MDIDGINSPRKIMSVRSANSGSSWNSPVNVDGISNGDVKKGINDKRSHVRNCKILLEIL